MKEKRGGGYKWENNLWTLENLPTDILISLLMPIYNGIQEWGHLIDKHCYYFIYRKTIQ